jgi:methionyl-tRNA formyltransferase
MNIILFTQEDPFYLCESTADLISKVQNQTDHQIIHAFITSPSVYGKQESFVTKALKTFKIFGYKFFIYYSIKYIYRKILLRKSVYKIIKKHGIAVSFVDDNINKEKYVQNIKRLDADFILIIAGNQIIKKQILSSSNYGVFNIHSSLLPKYKGLMPSFWALKNNEEETGVTLYKLTEGIDDGPIVSQRKLSIQDQTTHSSLVKKLKILANDLFIDSIDLIPQVDRYAENSTGNYYNFPNRKDILEFTKSNKKFF